MCVVNVMVNSKGNKLIKQMPPDLSTLFFTKCLACETRVCIIHIAHEGVEVI